MRAQTQEAPELHVERWIGPQGGLLDAPLKLSDIGEGLRVIFAFQDWCRGCHEHGFPSLQLLHTALATSGVKFAAIQTVFEGAHENTFEKLRVNQQRYQLPIPFGHDLPPAGRGLPTFMRDYQTGGTPWFAIVDPYNRIVFSDFHIDANRLVSELAQA